MDAVAHHTPARKLHLDVLRILAIVLVVFNHSPACIFPSYAATPAFAYYGMLVLDICCKIAVPLFFMISGALLLGRDESMSRLFSKRVMRFLIVIVAYGVLQYGFFIWTTHGEMLWSWKLLVRAIYSGWPVSNDPVGYPSAIWFLYAYLAMLLVLPFLRAMVRHLRDCDYLYLFALQIILVALLPSVMDTIYGVNLSAGGGAQDVVATSRFSASAPTLSTCCSGTSSSTVCHANPGGGKQSAGWWRWPLHASCAVSSVLSWLGEVVGLTCFGKRTCSIITRVSCCCPAHSCIALCSGAAPTSPRLDYWRR